jgi:hypothetical protein
MLCLIPFVRWDNGSLNPLVHGFGHNRENICMLQIADATFNASSCYASKGTMVEDLVVMGQ